MNGYLERPSKGRRSRRYGEEDNVGSESDWSDLEMLRSEAETVINNGSVVYGNVIGGNNAGEISSNFIENSIHERSLSAGDTQWSHTVFMPIGNTFKHFSVSANGTDINHTVNTDLGDNNTHTLGTAANSQSFTDEAADSDEDFDED